MRVLSLFDGISCGRVALERANIRVDRYYASEIDKFAIQISQKNYSDIIRLGDINNWKAWDVNWQQIDLILAGSPCQGFSFAGKQLAFDDPRSRLFFVFVDILNHARVLNPKVKFLLENVRMKKEYQQVISDTLKVEPMMINSALVSAQNRIRLYWANWHFNQPEDKGILLKDIVHETIDIINHKKLINFNCNPSGKGMNGNVTPITNNKSPTLTPIECERLQTLADNYTEGVSNTQRYKTLGNAWTVDVIVHLLKCLISN